VAAYAPEVVVEIEGRADVSPLFRRDIVFLFFNRNLRTTCDYIYIYSSFIRVVLNYVISYLLKSFISCSLSFIRRIVNNAADILGGRL